MPWVLITLRRSPGQEILVLRLCSNLIRLYLFCVLVLWWLLKPKVVFNPPQTKLHCMSSQLNTMFGIAVTTTYFLTFLQQPVVANHLPTIHKSKLAIKQMSSNAWSNPHWARVENPKHWTYDSFRPNHTSCWETSQQATYPVFYPSSSLLIQPTGVHNMRDPRTLFARHFMKILKVPGRVWK